MPINSIITHPATNSLNAAYRPVLVRAQAQGTGGTTIPPVVYCDIYFNGIFYKTLSKTQYSKLNASSSEWEFDIQDAAQEYLRKYIGPNGGTKIVESVPAITKAQCKLRSSGFDPSGFIVAEDTTPVQGTSGTPPVPGTGTGTNIFYVVNATLQHEDNQSLTAHLNHSKNGAWHSQCYPLTHRPNRYFVTPDDSDYYPIVIDPTLCVAKLRLNYKYKGQSTIRQMDAAITGTCSALITGINFEQVPGTHNAIISWTASGAYTSFLYSVDGGPSIQTSMQTVTVNGLSVGLHTVVVVPRCLCTNGNSFSQVFPILSSASYSCSSAISNIIVTQTDGMTAVVTFDSSGPATLWRYVLDGGAPVDITVKFINLWSIPVGDHTLVITPVCSNGATGFAGNHTFSIAAAPAIIKINEFVDSYQVRTQVFQIDAHVQSGNRFYMEIYGRVIQVTAVPGDTRFNIVIKLCDEINNTTEADWNIPGSAPPPGTPGFPPVASANGVRFSVTMNSANSFAYRAYVN